MLPPIFQGFILLVLIIWSGLLTYFLWQMIAHYNSLTDGVTSRNLREILDQLLNQTSTTRKDIETLAIRCDKIEQDGAYHIQKIGLLRFNPFKDTGGDQSFILSLLDGKDTGVVISALYSRSGTRWYAKKVLKGKGVEHELSDEEKKAIRISEKVTA